MYQVREARMVGSTAPSTDACILILCSRSVYCTQQHSRMWYYRAMYGVEYVERIPYCVPGGIEMY